MYNSNTALSDKSLVYILKAGQHNHIFFSIAVISWIYSRQNLEIVKICATDNNIFYSLGYNVKPHGSAAECYSRSPLMERGVEEDLH